MKKPISPARQSPPKQREPPTHNSQDDGLGFSFSDMMGESATSEQARAQIVKSLMDSDNIEMVTELSAEEIFQVSTISALNMNVNSKVVEKFLLTFLKTKVSHNRLGRREGIEIGKPEPMMGGGHEGQKPFWKFW